MSDNDLKVFISWSGDLSREVTKVIRHWLPKMFDRIDPWMSDIDIQAGTRGLALIEERLNQSQFGIIVVTVANMEKTWLNFEAGALSKKFGDSVLSRVVPIMVDLDSVYQIEGPIKQFQAISLDKNGMQSLLESIAFVTGSDWESVRARFEWSWDQFEQDIEKAKDIAGKQPEAPKLKPEDLLEQVLGALQQLNVPQATSPRHPEKSNNRSDMQLQDLRLRMIAEANGFNIRSINRTFGGGMIVNVGSTEAKTPKDVTMLRGAIQDHVGNLDISIKYIPSELANPSIGDPLARLKNFSERTVEVDEEMP